MRHFKGEQPDRHLPHGRQMPKLPEGTPGVGLLTVGTFLAAG